MDDVSAATRQDIHANEQRALLWGVLKRAPFLIAALVFWLVTGPQPSNPAFLLVGLMALPVMNAGWAWWRHRVTPPLSATPERIAELDARQDERAAVAEAMATRVCYVTYTIIAILVAVGVLQLAFAGSVQESIQTAGLVKPAVAAGQWWRLITATYLHGSMAHIYFNVAALLVLGQTMETYAPRWHLPLVYVSAGLAGSIASYKLLAATSVGASGAILGLAGYLLVMGVIAPQRLPKIVRTQAVMTIALTGYIGAFGFLIIDNAAHAGGALAGALIAWLLTPRRTEAETIASREWNLFGVVASTLILASAIGTATVLARAASGANVPTVTVSLANDPKDTVVLLDNQSDRTLEAYRIHIRLDGRVMESAWRDDCCFAPVSPDRPVSPHSTRRIVLKPLPPGFSIGRPSAHITLAVFDDGSYEGARDEYELLMRQRAWVADDAGYWLSVIDEERGHPHFGRYALFEKRVEERSRLSEFEPLSVDALGIATLIQAAGATPEAFDIVSARTKSNLEWIQQGLRARLAMRRP